MRTSRMTDAEANYMARAYEQSGGLICEFCGHRRDQHHMDDDWELEPCFECDCRTFTKRKEAAGERIP